MQIRPPASPGSAPSTELGSAVAPALQPQRQCRQRRCLARVQAVRGCCLSRNALRKIRMGELPDRGRSTVLCLP